MKSFRHSCVQGFTMIELLVVIAIIGILMAASATVIRDAGKGRGTESGLVMLQSLIEEAQATARGNDTYTRLVIVNDPADSSADSRHLSYMTVMMFKKRDGARNGYDGSSVDQDGKWEATSNGVSLPAGVFFSPYYSTPLEWAEGVNGSMIGEGREKIAGKGYSHIYYLEFDEKGRFVCPTADPLNVTRPQRLVLINARRGNGSKAHDGIVPLDLDANKRPVGARGIVIYPNGELMVTNTPEETIDLKAVNAGAGFSSKRPAARGRGRR